MSSSAGRQGGDESASAVMAQLAQSLDHHVSIIGLRESPPAVRRHAATQLLGTISRFMGRWEQDFAANNNNNNNRNNQRDSGFPTGMLREALSSLVVHIGHGDSQLRGFLLAELETVSVTTSRQLLLDFLPSTMPMMRESSYANPSSATTTTPANEQLEAATEQVIETLRGVLAKDPSALLPVIGCLSTMPLSNLGRKESFQVALNSLEFVSETDLPILATTLLKHAESDEDAVLALEALRAELHLMESSESNTNNMIVKGGEDPIAVVAHVVLNALFDDANDNRIARAYGSCLEGLVTTRLALKQDQETVGYREHKNNKKDCRSDNNNGEFEAYHFLLLDMVILLAIYQHPDHVNRWEGLLDSLLQENRFPFATLSNLVLLICDEKKFGRPTSILYPRIIQSLVSMGIFLLLSPARLDTSAQLNASTRQNLEKVMKQSQEFVVNLHHHADREVQAELVHSLLHLSDKCASTKWVASTTKVGSRKRRREAMTSLHDNDGNRFEWFQVTINDTVNTTLQIMAQKSKLSFSNFKHILIGRLTNLSFQSADWERRCMQHISGVLSALIEPTLHASSITGGGGGGIQASEIMIILQKLLFTSSHATFASSGPGNRSGDNRRVVRGLLLATELVKSPLLSNGDWDCVKQWVLRVLLPTTRRMVDPDIGTPGLSFLEALMIDRNYTIKDEPKAPLQLKKEAFQHMKMVLANTGLIQILAHYQQQQQRQKSRRSDTPVLAYLAKPGDSFVTESPKKRKKRDMVFCLAFFLGNSELYVPSRWAHTVSWVFHLVDTYLRVGRDISLSSSASVTGSNGQANKKDSSNNKWIPHGWLQAAIEYPAIALTKNIAATSKKQKHALDWIKGILKSPVESALFRGSEIQSGLVDLFCSAESISQLSPVFDSVLRVGLSLLLGISLSFAVVKNCFAHYQSFPYDEEGNKNRAEVLRLIQFQMGKIYDMQMKCKSIEIVMGAAIVCIRRLKRAALESRGSQKGPKSIRDDESLRSNQSSDQDREKGASRLRSGLDVDVESAKRYSEHLALALNQQRYLLRGQFTSADFVSVEVIFACLVDGNQDVLIKTCIDSIILSPTSAMRPNHATVVQLMNLRQSLLDHSISVLSESGNDLAIRNTWFARSAEIGLHLCSALPKLRKVGHGCRGDVACWGAISATIQSVSTLAASYLQFVFVALTQARIQGQLVELGQHAEHTMVSQFTEHIDACSKMFASKDGFNGVEQNDSDAVENAFAGFLFELQENDESTIACQLLEILSVLSQSPPRGRLGQQLLMANWKALHTVYASSTETEAQTTMPYSLAGAIRSAGLGSTKQQKQIDKCFQDTVLSLRGSETGRNGSIRQSILRHWGLLALFPSATDKSISHLLTIHEELAVLLDSFDDSAGRDDHDEEEKKDDGRRRNHDAISSETCNQKRGRKSESAVCSIPDLHGTSFPIAFETLLHATVAGMGILSIDCSEHGGSQNGTQESGPYGSFESLMMLFHSLVDLYMKRAHLFPRRTLSTVFTATKHMLGMTVNQARACVEWRNSQPLLSIAEKNRGCYDPGAVSYLQAFLDTCWTHTTVPILSFCDFVKGSEEEERTETSSKLQPRNQKRNDDDEYDDDDDYDDNNDSNTIANRNMRNTRNKQRHVAKANSLRYTVEKVAVVFKDIASSHNLTTPDLVEGTTASVNVLSRKRKSRGGEDKGFHQLQGRKKAKQVASSSKSSNKEDDVSSASEEGRDAPSPSNRVNHATGRRSAMTADLFDDKEEDDWSSEDEASNSLSHDGSQGLQDSSRAFGATGNWGEDDSSSGSLVMDTSLF